MTANVKYTLVLKSGILLSVNGNVVLFDTYDQAFEALKTSEDYVHVTQAYTELKHVVTHSKSILQGSILDTRLSELSVVVVEGDNLPDYFKDKFSVVVKTTEFKKDVIEALKTLSRAVRQPVLICTSKASREMHLAADLYLQQCEDFYQILKFRSTTRYSNNYTLFDLNI